MKYAATCLFGLEKFVGETIDTLGYQRIETIDGRVYFEGDLSAVPRCNINFRTAEKLYLVLGEFHAETFEELYQGTKNLPWERFILKNDAFPVKGHCIKSKLFSLPDCQKIIKKAIVERLKSKYAVSWFEETGVKYQVEFFLLNNHAALMIDTSGDSLYKRGYRLETGAAPIRETLANALVSIARPRHDVLLWDPMCGSGTIPIEAALLLSDTAPGLFRGFASERFPCIPKQLWQSARGEAKDRIKTEPFEVYGSDIDPAAVELAAANAKRSGLGSKIRFFQMDVKDIQTYGKRGTVVCNPPYGERLLDIQSAEKLYRSMGKAFSGLPNWQIYVITPDEYFEKHFGRTADKHRKMYNGMIKCVYYQFYKNR